MAFVAVAISDGQLSISDDGESPTDQRLKHFAAAINAPDISAIIEGRVDALDEKAAEEKGE